MDIGIIGFGYMGKWHYNQLKKNSIVNDIYIYDNDLNIKISAQQYDVIVCDNLECIMSKKLINTIIIATPNDSHALYIEMALQNNKNVICEKPVTLNFDALVRLEHLSKKKGLIFTVHQNRRWDIDFLTIQKSLQNGALGNPVSIESRVYAQRGIMYGWRAREECGGGMLLDWGVHLIDQMLLLQDRAVTSIYANLKSVMTETVDDYFSIKLKFDNGTTGLVEAGTFALRKLPRWFIYGDNGTLVIDDFDCKNGGITYLKSYCTNQLIVDNVVDNVVGTSRLLHPISPQQTKNIRFPLDIESLDNIFYDNFFKAIQGLTSIYIQLSQIKRVMKIIDLAKIAAEKNEVIKTNI